MKAFKLHMVIIIAILLLGTAGVQAGLTGVLAGKITDTNGDPMPGVTVTITGNNLPGNRVDTTSGSGTFRMPELPPGIYTLVAEMMGMETITQTNIKVAVNATTNIKLVMRIAGAEYVESIIAEGISVDTRSVTVKSVIEAEMTERLPGSDDLYAAYSMSGGITGGGNVNSSNIGSGLPANHPPPSTEEYDAVSGQKYQNVIDMPLSTFSIDVDTASYANARRMLNSGYAPLPESVRIEEFINYFTYDYPQPENDEDAFSVNYEVSTCPWDTSHRLVHIGIQGRKIDMDEAPPGNFVFLIDVSGSMNNHNKLPLLKKGFKLLVNELDEDDTISIVTYAGHEGLALPATSGADKDIILKALDNLRSGGSTAGAAGIRLAYQIAQENFIEGGNNRVILATDGDFNVGIRSDDDMIKLIEEKRKSGVFLSTLGFGMGNYKDSKMEKLADHGNGNYSYIDNIREARKVLVTEMGGTLLAIAKDVKLQVEFNPAKVDSYRLIGYENRILATEDFDDDTKDAGELGAGHTVTALYEIVPAKSAPRKGGHSMYRYQSHVMSEEAMEGNELFNLKLRYKQPDGHVSRLIEMPLKNKVVRLKRTSDNYRFSAAVALFGMLLRQSEYAGDGTFEMVLDLASDSLGDDEFGYRAEFLRLVEETQLMDEVGR